MDSWIFVSDNTIIEKNVHDLVYKQAWQVTKSYNFKFIISKNMAKKLFVGNIDWGTTKEEIDALFSQHGTIEDSVIISDRMTGRPKGFGFVTFTNDEEGDAAVEALNN